MANGVKITDKKPTSRRYDKTENCFLMEFLEKGGNVTVTEMARKLGVARSTFYYHHKKMVGMVRDYKEWVLDDYHQLIQEMSGKNATMTNLFLRILIFIKNHSMVFRVLVILETKDVLLEMVLVLKPEVERFARLSKGSSRLFEIYAYEVAGILKIWVEEGMPEEKMKVVLDDLMILTSTINKRLGFLERKH